ncbi:hypothetical protein COCCADRAFT_109303 [Bipolaris zeicola 26-R-13]|uniref:Rhodopsin domain-containing protein n=1 Tax=Cochliobolus carbonum (strain 26-R-13) TaxID=930089 RepID=W6Y068_COCC2|nr:uncharacterized protein COCCADRAFT_109303 [Bipolaris zeicola 26-R-13]EUC28384.1 hypothetical protein COCCADRAFT_109303 [Bipolaris zeicola 26-R-13]
MALSNLQPLAYAVAYITFVLGTISIFLRFYCRRCVLHLWGWDDHFTVLILVFSIGQQLILHMFLYWGCGLHMTTLTTHQQLQIIKWLFIEQVVYYSVHWVIKSAFLLFYLRLSTRKPFRIAIYMGGVINGTILIINTLMACFQCVPFDEILHPGTHPNAVCINRLAMLIVPSVLNILADFYILILPICTVWHLQMSMARKLRVIGVVAFGSSSVIIACFRLIPLFELFRSPDTSWVLGKMVIIAALEIQCAVIAVNLPSLKPLWTRMMGGSSSGSGPGGDSDSNNKKYRLSSRGHIVTFGSEGRELRAGKWARKSHRGSVARTDQGLTVTESEEELCRQGGISLRMSNQISVGDAGIIKIQKDIHIQSSEGELDKVMTENYVSRG